MNWAGLTDLPAGLGLRNGKSWIRRAEGQQTEAPGNGLADGGTGGSGNPYGKLFQSVWQSQLGGLSWQALCPVPAFPELTLARAGTTVKSRHQR